MPRDEYSESESGSESRSESESRSASGSYSESRSDSGSYSDESDSESRTPLSPRGDSRSPRSRTPASPSRSATPAPRSPAPPPGIRPAVESPSPRTDRSPDYRPRSPAATATRRLDRSASPRDEMGLPRDSMLRRAVEPLSTREPEPPSRGTSAGKKPKKEKKAKKEEPPKEERRASSQYSDREREAMLHQRMEKEHAAFMEQHKQESSRRKPPPKSEYVKGAAPAASLSPNAPRGRKYDELPGGLRKAVGQFEDMIKRKAEEATLDSPAKGKKGGIFGGKEEMPKEQAKSPDSPMPHGDDYTLTTSVSDHVSQFLAKVKDIKGPEASSKKPKPVNSWVKKAEEEEEVALPATEKKAKKDKPSPARPRAASEKKQRRKDRAAHEASFGDEAYAPLPRPSLAELAALDREPVQPKPAPTWVDWDRTGEDDEGVPLSPSAHRAEIAGVKAFLESQLQSLRETLEVDAQAIELQLVQDEMALSEDRHSPSPRKPLEPPARFAKPEPREVNPEVARPQRQAQMLEPHEFGAEEDTHRAAYQPSDKVRIGAQLLDRSRIGQSPQSPEFQSPRSDKSSPRKASALTELRKVAETSVARARELELACRELADRDQLVAELQERLDVVRNEYRSEVMTLRSDLASVKEHLEATRQEKSIMEEEFLQELARLEAERAELLGAKHFLEEQVSLVEKDAAMATAKHLESQDTEKRLEAQVKALEAKMRHLGDISDQGKAQLVKTATQAEAKDAIIAELREQVKDLQRSGKRQDNELRRLGSKLQHESQERDHFAGQIEDILSEFGIQHRSVTPSRVRDAPPTRTPG